MAAGRKLAVGCSLAAMILMLIVAGCDRPENSAHQVVDDFIRALHNKDQGLLDSVMAWDEVALNQYYVPRNYYESLDEGKRREVVEAYRKLFYQDCFPLAAAASYAAEKVYIARGTGNAILTATFPRRQAGSTQAEEKQQFNLELSLFKDRNRWYIVDLNDFVQLNMLQGEFDPGKFYLPEPIH